MPARALLASDLVSVNLTLLAQLIAFVILLYFLVRLLYRPLTTAMNARAERIRASLSQSDEAAKAAQEAQARTQAQLDQARVQAQEILRQAAQSGETLREQIVSQARSEAEKVIERGKADIQRERQAAVDELRRVVGDVAIMAAGRVVQKSLDTQENRRLIDQAITQSDSFGNAGLQ